MTFAQTQHCVWSCRTERGNYIIQNYGKGDWTWYVATKTNAVSVESYDDALIACREHLRAAYRYQQIVGRSKRTPIEWANNGTC